MPRTSRRSYVDVFAGAGGLSLGLSMSGWSGLFAIEKSPMAFETLRHNLIETRPHFNWPEWLPLAPTNINTLLRKHQANLKELKGNVDLVAGGPPCQGFSFAGRRNEHDQRNQLVSSYVHFIKHIKPELILFENVAGFCSTLCDGEPYSTMVENKIKKLGYSIEKEIVEFKEFGIPQRRARYILVGSNSTRPDEFFIRMKELRKLFLEKRKIKVPVSTKDAISDLERVHGEMDSPESIRFKAGLYGKPRSAYQHLMRSESDYIIPDSHRFANHSPKTIKWLDCIISMSPKGKKVPKRIMKRFKTKKHTIRLIDENAPCPTLTTLPDDFVHYSEPRILTVREYARIQSFYDWYEFKTKYTTGGSRRRTEVPRYTQIGNAIPPLFMEQAGIVLRGLL